MFIRFKHLSRFYMYLYEKRKVLTELAEINFYKWSQKTSFW